MLMYYTYRYIDKQHPLTTTSNIYNTNINLNSLWKLNKYN